MVPIPEKRKVGGSTPPLTTTLTCADVSLVIVEAQLMTVVVSFLVHLLQRTAAQPQVTQGELREGPLSRSPPEHADSACDGGGTTKAGRSHRTTDSAPDGKYCLPP